MQRMFHEGADIIVGIERPNGKDARWIKSISPETRQGERRRIYDNLYRRHDPCP